MCIYLTHITMSSDTGGVLLTTFVKIANRGFCYVLRYPSFADCNRGGYIVPDSTFFQVQSQTSTPGASQMGVTEGDKLPI